MAPKTVFVLSAPGPLRDGLKAVLDTFPSLISIGCVDITHPALSEVEKERPQIIIMNPSPSEEGLDQFVREVAQRFPATHSIVMTKHACRLSRLMEAGANNVWLKGISANEMCTRLEAILCR